jgi:hypothetical protein
MSRLTLSKHLKNGRHVGFKKYVFGRNFHLVTGTTTAHERIALTIARALVARGDQLRATGGTWTEAAIEECFAVGKPRQSDPQPTETTPPQPVTAAVDTAEEDGEMLYAVMELYKKAETQREKSKKISHCHAANNIYRIEWSKEGLSDRPMRPILLRELKEWVNHFASRPMSTTTSKPISAYTASGIIRCIGHFLDFADAEGYWTPCHRWKDAFKKTHPKRLMTPLEKNLQKRVGFVNLTVREAHIIWHQALPDARALYGLGLWTGNTQNELATILLDGEFVERDGELYLERDRHKTGVWGKWWIPPEVATWVRKRLANTARDGQKNPWQCAFLTGKGMPLVHFGKDNDKPRSDSVEQMWAKMLKAAAPYDVRHVSFKFLRKTMSQEVRNELGVEFATLFCAQKIDPLWFSINMNSVQDEFYSNSCFKKLENCMRNVIYPKWKKMFEKIDLEAEWKRLEAEKAVTKDKAA